MFANMNAGSIVSLDWQSSAEGEAILQHFYDPQTTGRKVLGIYIYIYIYMSNMLHDLLLQSQNESRLCLGIFGYFCAIIRAVRLLWVKFIQKFSCKKCWVSCVLTPVTDTAAIALVINWLFKTSMRNSVEFS
jgi:hypothetical protein